MKKLLCGLSILFTVAYCAGYNHPEIKWRTVTTEHFAINYYDKTEPALYASWKIAEETFAAIAPLFDYKLRNRIELSLADYDDYSNGWADYTSGAIMIWIPDAQMEFRANNTWLRNVISHEITHILSLESKRRSKMIDMVVDLNLQGPYETVTVQEVAAKITPWPNWFVEGIAQLGSERMGHDCWDTRREMLLRTAVMNNRQLSIDEMGVFSHDSRGNEQVYNQGYSFVKFLVNRCGLDTVTSILRSGASERIDFRTEFSNRTGRQVEAFYAEWLDSLRESYKVRFPSAPSAKTVLSHDALINAVPQVSLDKRYIGYLSSGRDDAGQTSLLIYDYATGKKVHEVRYAHTTWAFSKDSRKVYFVKSRDPDRHGSFLNDLFSFDLQTGQTTQLTKAGRIYNVAVSPINGAVGVVSFDKGVFLPGILDIGSGNIRNIAKTVIGDPIIRISWSPLDSSKFIAEKLVDGVSKLFVYSTVDTTVTGLTSNTAREESPYWANDGRIYFNADYDGVNNIYSINSDGTDLKRYTNTNTGCFSPVAVDNSTIIYSGYSASGFTIVKSESSGETYQIPSMDACTFKALPAPKGKVTINATPYRPHYGRSLSEFAIFGNIQRNDGFIMKDDNVVIDTTAYSAGVSLSFFKQDPLQKKNRAVGLAAGIDGLHESNATSKKRNFNSSKLSVGNNFLRQKALMKMPEAKGEILTSKIIRNNDFSTRLNQVFESQATNADSSDTNTPNIQIFLQPSLSLVNREGAGTLQLQVAAITPIIPIPVIIQASLLSEYQLSKNATIGFGIVPIISIEPWIFGQIPIVFNWSSLGTYNEDFNYNFNNASQITISTGAEFNPYQKIEYVNTDSADTSLYNVNSFYASAGFFHAFSLGKYNALQLALQGNYSLYDRYMLFRDYYNSHYYVTNMMVQSVANVNLVFPIVRNINSGNYYYFDNFYGSVGYSLTLEMNDQFLKNPTKRILYDKNYLGFASAGHLISAKLELGHYKSNMYFKKFIVGIDYELLREKVYLKVASEF
jgi:Tol biopolymer transport system component